MATLTISLNTGTAALNATKSLTAGDLSALQAAFTEILQDQGNPSPTPQDIFTYWVQRWVADTVTAVRQQQQATASAAVSSIAMSPP